MEHLFGDDTDAALEVDVMAATYGPLVELQHASADEATFTVRLCHPDPDQQASVWQCLRVQLSSQFPRTAPTFTLGKSKGLQGHQVSSLLEMGCDPGCVIMVCESVRMHMETASAMPKPTTPSATKPKSTKPPMPTKPSQPTVTAPRNSGSTTTSTTPEPRTVPKHSRSRAPKSNSKSHATPAPSSLWDVRVSDSMEQELLAALREEGVGDDHDDDADDDDDEGEMGVYGESSSVGLFHVNRTRRRLDRAYKELEGLGFAHDAIELGMRETLGRPVQATLDWLCLNLPSDELPAGIAGGTMPSVNAAAKATGSGGGSGDGMEDTTERIVWRKETQDLAKGTLRSYAFANWRGKSPKALFHEWCQKNRVSSPKYSKVKHKGVGFRYRVSFMFEGGSSKVSTKLKAFKGERQSVRTAEACETAADAQHLVATWALYQHNSDRALDTLLPPPFSRAWRAWIAHEQQQTAAHQAEADRPRMELVAELVDTLQAQWTRARRAQARRAARLAAQVGHASNGSGAASPNHAHASSAARSVIKPRVCVLRQNKSEDTRLRKWWCSRIREPGYQAMVKQRQSLPVYSRRALVMEAIRDHPYTIVCGATGSGKTTQVPQFIVDDALASGNGHACSVICTQPRRIMAMSISQRVSEEMGEPRNGGLVGYQVRLESRRSRNTKLLFCTTGVLLRRLQQSDPLLRGVSHVVVDEVHERSVDSDFLLVRLKQVMTRRADLKVVLMSATVDSAKFSTYLHDCPVVDIPGRTFPVDVMYVEDVIQATNYSLPDDSPFALDDNHVQRLVRRHRERTGAVVAEDGDQVRRIVGTRQDKQRVEVCWDAEGSSEWQRAVMQLMDAKAYSAGTRRTVARLNAHKVNPDLIEEALLWITTKKQYAKIDGAILVFLPGIGDISRLHEQLTKSPHFCNSNKFVIYPLHSVLSSSSQAQVFSVPPNGIRKIVLSTNIAETGITIPDVVFVIDCGLANEMRELGGAVSALKTVRISQANAAQRSGRAGRVRPGVAIRLFPRHEWDTDMSPFAIPEILRTPLAHICLSILSRSKHGSSGSSGDGNGDDDDEEDGGDGGDDERVDPFHFLGQCLDVPAKDSIRSAMNTLYDAGALAVGATAGNARPTFDEGHCYALSTLGRYLSQLPVEVHVGRMLVYGAVLQCLQPVLIMAASLSGQSPFKAPLRSRAAADAARARLFTAHSDLLTLYKAYAKWEHIHKQKGSGAARQYCVSHYLDVNTLRTIKATAADLRTSLVSMGLVNPRATGSGGSFYERNSKDVSVLRAVIVAALYPNVAQVRIRYDPKHQAARAFCIEGSKGKRLFVHPRSVNHDLSFVLKRVTAASSNDMVTKDVALNARNWIVYHKKLRTTKLYLHGTTWSSPMPLLLFGGPLVANAAEQTLRIGDWMDIRASPKTAALFSKLRIHLDELLAREIRHPGHREHPLVRLIVKLLREDAQG